MKTVETLKIEQVLRKSLFGSNPKLAKEYGTTEVTVGFQRDSHGKEIVDFLSYDPKKDIFKCYEIKVTIADFHSDAAKSWHGNYNYLVLSRDLYLKQDIMKWITEIPVGVGIITINTDNSLKETVRRAVKQDIDADTKEMLKDSLIRTLFYQNQKYNE